MNLDLNIYTILVTKYEKIYSLPKDWDRLEDIKVKIELLAQAINKQKRVEELNLFKTIVGEDNNDESK